MLLKNKPLGGNHSWYYSYIKALFFISKYNTWTVMRSQKEEPLGGRKYIVDIIGCGSYFGTPRLSSYYNISALEIFIAYHELTTNIDKQTWLSLVQNRQSPSRMVPGVIFTSVTKAHPHEMISSRTEERPRNSNKLPIRTGKYTGHFFSELTCWLIKVGVSRWGLYETTRWGWRGEPLGVGSSSMFSIKIGTGLDISSKLKQQQIHCLK